MKKIVIAIIVGSAFFIANTIKENNFTPPPAVIMQNDTHQFLEDPITKNITIRNKITKEKINLNKTRTQLNR